MKSLQILLIAISIAVYQAYPIIVYNSNLGRSDLFLNEDEILERLTQQQYQKIHIFNIQTTHDETDLFVREIRKSSLKLRTLQTLFESSFVSPYIKYHARNFEMRMIEKSENLEKSIEISQTNVNFYNLKAIEDELTQMSRKKELKDTIIVIVFTRNISNMKILQQIQESSEFIGAQVASTTDSEVAVNTDVQSAERVDAQVTETISEQSTNTEQGTDEATTNEVYAMSSNMIEGYIIFLASVFTLWIATGCMIDIKTPDRFIKTNFAFGKEN